MWRRKKRKGQDSSMTACSKYGVAETLSLTCSQDQLPTKYFSSPIFSFSLKYFSQYFHQPHDGSLMVSIPLFCPSNHGFTSVTLKIASERFAETL
jgi:hypothetical protein